MKSVLVALGLLAGCDKVFSLDTVPHDGPAPDVAIDSPPTDAGQTCIGGLYFLVCYDAGEVGAPISVLPGGSRTIDTTDDAACTQTRNAGGELPLCIAIVSSIDVEAMGTLRVTGPRPLVLATDGDVTIQGTVDVGSHGGTGLAGAGADPSTCPPAVEGETQQAGTNHAGGGAGGSYIGTGGTGGRGETTSAVARPAMANAPFVAGGCPGGAGGKAISGPGGAGGHGGGAIYLIAKGTLTLSGKISASGQGGASHNSTSSPADFPGGGGGGAGGMIVLEADTVLLSSSAALIASGGGGGGGGNGNINGLGGGDGTFVGGTGGAGGAGGGSSFGGSGGSGSTPADMAGKDGLAGGSLQGGGGGGGGGAGIIRLHAVTLLMNKSTQISPQPMP